MSPEPSQPEIQPLKTPITFSLAPPDNERLAQLCGQFDAHLRQIESHLDVGITHRGGAFSIDGREADVAAAEQVIHALYEATGGDSKPLTAGDVHLALSKTPDSDDEQKPEIVIKVRRHQVRAQNPRQYRYLRNILSHDINFGIGPAGTGKTYLAVACAAQALAENEIERIVLVRPAVEAGERLGFLPGDIGQKVDPFLRPLYDALYEMLGFERVGKLIGRGVIELAPLAYMRGRTLNEAFIILDEAQNTTVEQMKMFLTRIGFGSRAVITGDITQVDLPKGTLSGLRHAQQVMHGIQGISITRFKPQDVVRHPLVQRIVEAYERVEQHIYSD
ncbi:MAG: PhoH family protein [Pseudomonadota bacterium]|nr:PhoH family protein [Pseudomonadota bacterium]